MALRQLIDAEIPEAYLARERAAASKSEFVDGRTFAMAGGSRRHSLVAGNSLVALRAALEGRPCEVHGSDLRVGSSAAGFFAYPDVSLVCGLPIFEDQTQDTLTNPSLIVEVLSPSTEAYDRGLKFAHYRRLGSLSCYLLLSQDEPVVDCYTRESEGWLYRQVEGLEGQVDLPSFGIVLKLGDLFARVAFDTRQGL